MIELKSLSDEQISNEYEKRGLLKVTREWATDNGFTYWSTYSTMEMYIREGDEGLGLCFRIKPEPNREKGTIIHVAFNTVEIKTVVEFKKLYKEKYGRDF